MHDDNAFEASVLIFREDSEWTALALEMNLRGHGRNPKEAISDLGEMLLAQISFAVQMGHPESVWHRADEKYWRMYEETRKIRFVAEVSGAKVPTDRMAELVPLPLIALSQRENWAEARA